MPVPAERELQEVRYVADVLVAYATKNGSTQQVAEPITVALREAGSQVTALPARGVRASVAGYELCWARRCTPGAGTATRTGSSSPSTRAGRRAGGRVRHGAPQRHRGGLAAFPFPA